MAVFTPLDRTQIETFLRDYSCGRLSRFQGIAEGTQNSNFHVSTDQGRYVLTVVEQDFTPDDIAFFLAYMDALNRAGIPCPAALRRRDGLHNGRIMGKIALLAPFLEGENVDRGSVTEAHCRSLGATLARMHLAGQALKQTRKNREGIPFLKSLTEKIRRRAEEVEKLEPGFMAIIDEEFAWLEKNIPLDLPHAALHADLFPDNVFFRGTNVSGVIDFYYACTATVIYDLAIVVNAWCFDARNVFRPERLAALMFAYEQTRRLDRREWNAFRTFGRAAAMRFLITRLHDWVYHDPKNLVTPRDPLEFLEKLRFHQREGALES